MGVSYNNIHLGYFGSVCGAGFSVYIKFVWHSFGMLSSGQKIKYMLYSLSSEVCTGNFKPLKATMLWMAWS